MLNGQKDEDDKIKERLIPVGQHKVSEYTANYDAPKNHTFGKVPYHCVFIGGKEELKQLVAVKANVIHKDEQIRWFKRRNKAIKSFNNPSKKISKLIINLLNKFSTTYKKLY